MFRGYLEVFNTRRMGMSEGGVVAFTFSLPSSSSSFKLSRIGMRLRGVVAFNLGECPDRPMYFTVQRPVKSWLLRSQLRIVQMFKLVCNVNDGSQYPRSMSWEIGDRRELKR